MINELKHQADKLKTARSVILGIIKKLEKEES